MTPFECGVCWSGYDPAEGDPVWQIEPGTAFEALPAHWRCPKCDAPKEKFLAKPQPLGERLVRAWRTVMPRLAGLPVTNSRLTDVLCSRVVSTEGGQLAVVMTPWCLNAVWVADDGRAVATRGATVVRALPSGTYDFVAGELEGVGPVLSLSLMSPVLEFDGLEAGQVAVDAAFEALLLAPVPVQVTPTMGTSRRELFDLLRPSGP